MTGADSYSASLCSATGMQRPLTHTCPPLQMTGAAPGALPPATPADMGRYQAAFQQLDADKDGLVQGADCFTYFMQVDQGCMRGWA